VKTETISTARVSLAFVHVTLEWVLEITFLYALVCLTTGEQVTKYCLKFLSGYCRNCTPDEMAAA